MAENSETEDVKITSINRNLTSLSDVITKPMFVLRFNDSDCIICIEHILDILKSLSDSIGKENILILTRYSDVRYLKIFNNMHHINLESYNYAKILISPIETCDILHKGKGIVGLCLGYNDQSCAYDNWNRKRKNAGYCS